MMMKKKMKKKTIIEGAESGGRSLGVVLEPIREAIAGPFPVGSRRGRQRTREAGSIVVGFLLFFVVFFVVVAVVTNNFLGLFRPLAKQWRPCSSRLTLG